MARCWILKFVTISMPSRRVSDAPGVRRSHNLAVFIIIIVVGRRPVEDPVENREEKRNTKSTARASICSSSTPREYNAKMSYRNLCLSLSLFI